MGHVPAIVVFVSPERMLGLIQRDQQVLDMGVAIVIYGIGAGFSGEDVFVERCPDELLIRHLSERVGNDLIRLVGAEPTMYPELPPRTVGPVRNVWNRDTSRPHSTGPSHFRKTNNGWRR